MTKERKQEVINTHKREENDTGSPKTTTQEEVF